MGFVQSRRALDGLAACAALIFSCAATCASAGSVSFDFNTEFSGGQAPSGPAPWIIATLADTSTPGVVLLTITVGGLTGNESLSGLYLNVNPALNVPDLTFTGLNTGPGNIAASSIQLGEDAFKADGDGRYDVLLNYPAGSGAGTFSGTLSSSYDITYSGSGTLSAASFYFLSTPMGGHGPFLAAAHVQNTTGAGAGGSGWLAPVPQVPLPAALWLFICGLGGLAGLARPRAVSP
ncbi:MAG: hypothetical protein PVSMB6_10380 [Steroidobacteraceae bacterium]